MNCHDSKEKMNIVIAGHVDHGKSTIIGRLLSDTKSLPEGKLEEVKERCARNSKIFEYAFLIDALKDEQSQGITIDTARVFFKTKKRDYIILDAPGHIEFLKNMVTGASRAEAALLVIDAQEGIKENSKRHGYILSMLGIKQISVIVNKMDLVSYSKDIFDGIVKDYSQFLSDINLHPLCFIPVSGITGINISENNKELAWYKDGNLVDVLDNFEKEASLINKPFRMFVQDVYKFSSFGDNRRIIAGTVHSGSIRTGDEITFYPSGKKSKVKTIESFNGSPVKELYPGYAAGLTLQEQIYVTRGEIAVKPEEKRPEVTSRLKVSLFWLGKEPVVKDKEYTLKVGTAKVPVSIEKINRIIDASTLDEINTKEIINRHDVAECILKLKKPVAFDTVEELPVTGRFIVADNYEIRGGGIILEALEDKQTSVRSKVFRRNSKWEQSMIDKEQRAEKYNQRSTLVLITGGKNTGKKPVAKSLERKLFEDGKFVYFMGIGNVLYGVDADIKGKNNNKEEHLRRVAEVANILLDTGIILIVTAIELRGEDIELIETVIPADRTVTIWMGEEVTTDVSYDLKVRENKNPEETVNKIKRLLQERGVIFKPW
jgi:bifunctional enzyme CysN/CysC